MNYEYSDTLECCCERKSTHDCVPCNFGAGMITTWSSVEELALADIGAPMTCDGALGQNAAVYLFSPWRAGDNLAQIPVLTHLLLASVSHLGIREVLEVTQHQPKNRETERTISYSVCADQMMLCAHRKLMGNLSSCLHCLPIVRSGIWCELSLKET